MLIRACTLNRSNTVILLLSIYEYLPCSSVQLRLSTISDTCGQTVSVLGIHGIM